MRFNEGRNPCRASGRLRPARETTRHPAAPGGAPGNRTTGPASRSGRAPRRAAPEAGAFIHAAYRDRAADAGTRRDLNECLLNLQRQLARGVKINACRPFCAVPRERFPTSEEETPASCQYRSAPRPRRRGLRGLRELPAPARRGQLESAGDEIALEDRGQREICELVHVVQTGRRINGPAAKCRRGESNFQLFVL